MALAPWRRYRFCRTADINGPSAGGEGGGRVGVAGLVDERCPFGVKIAFVHRSVVPRRVSQPSAASSAGKLWADLRKGDPAGTHRTRA
jgi:hypothetical protein